MKRLVYAVIAGIAIIAGCHLTTENSAKPPVQGTENTEILIVDLSKKLPSNPYQEEYEKMLYPTVRIKTPFSTGSGVIFTTPMLRSGLRYDSAEDTESTEAIYILTAAHVVRDESTVTVEIFTAKNAKNAEIPAIVVMTDTAKDLALLCVLSDLCGEKVYSAQLAPKDYTPCLFAPVWAVGCSLGLPPRPSQGIITSLGDLCASVVNWEISAPILPGNSGGPVYDANTYEVIGIAVWVQTYQGQLITTMAGIVPVSEIYEFLKEYTD